MCFSVNLLVVGRCVGRLSHGRRLADGALKGWKVLSVNRYALGIARQNSRGGIRGFLATTKAAYGQIYSYRGRRGGKGVHAVFQLMEKSAAQGGPLLAGQMVGESELLIYGGRSPTGQVLDDAAVVDVARLEWMRGGATSYPRCSHAATTAPTCECLPYQRSWLGADNSNIDAVGLCCMEEAFEKNGHVSFILKFVAAKLCREGACIMETVISDLGTGCVSMLWFHSQLCTCS